MYPESITAALRNLRHKVLAVIDSVAKTFDSGIAPLSVATAGINACQLLLCQLSGMALTRNHGGSEINKYLLRTATYGSYIWRNSHSFWSVANPSRTVTPVSASAFRKAVKLEGGSIIVAIKKPRIATMYLNASILFLVTEKLGLPPVYALTLPA